MSDPRDGLARFGTVPAGAPLSHGRVMRNPPLGVGQGGVPADPFPAGGSHGGGMRRPGRAPSARSADAPGQREDRRVLGPVPTPDKPARGPPACERLDSSRDARFRCALALRNGAVWGCMGGGGYSCSKTSKFLDMLKTIMAEAGQELVILPRGPHDDVSLARSEDAPIK